MAEADMEHEFETLYQRLVASLDALREAVDHATLVLDGLIKYKLKERATQHRLRGLRGF
jgi:hypothetical protein